jgi:hypothetical protein
MKRTQTLRIAVAGEPGDLPGRGGVFIRRPSTHGRCIQKAAAVRKSFIRVENLVSDKRVPVLRWQVSAFDVPLDAPGFNEV